MLSTLTHGSEIGRICVLHRYCSFAYEDAATKRTTDLRKTTGSLHVDASLSKDRKRESISVLVCVAKSTATILIQTCLRNIKNALHIVIQVSGGRALNPEYYTTFEWSVMWERILPRFTSIFPDGHQQSHECQVVGKLKVRVKSPLSLKRVSLLEVTADNDPFGLEQWFLHISHLFCGPVNNLLHITTHNTLHNT